MSSILRYFISLRYGYAIQCLLDIKPPRNFCGKCLIIFIINAVVQADDFGLYVSLFCYVDLDARSNTVLSTRKISQITLHPEFIPSPRLMLWAIFIYVMGNSWSHRYVRPVWYVIKTFQGGDNLCPTKRETVINDMSNIKEGCRNWIMLPWHPQRDWLQGYLILMKFADKYENR